MRILLTNDDGIFAEGIGALADAVADLGELVVVAPDREQSASGHALTLHRPLRISQVRPHWYAVDGTPSDCVNLAINGLLKEEPPDLVISGINYGANLGDDVTYSGTVNAAFEASLHQLPGVAFSQVLEDGFSMSASAALARQLLGEVLDGGIPKGLLLNVNFPPQHTGGVRFAKLGKRHYVQGVKEVVDKNGRKTYWIAGVPQWEDLPGTDHLAVSEGHVSITPLHLDLTDYAGLEEESVLRRRLEAVVLEAAAE